MGRYQEGRKERDVKIWVRCLENRTCNFPEFCSVVNDTPKQLSMLHAVENQCQEARQSFSHLRPGLLTLSSPP